jgi:hypothetical protein
MKFKTTLILLAAFAVLLAAVILFEKKGPGPEGPVEKLVQIPSADVEKVSLKRDAETLTFKKNDQSEWMIVEPMEVKADSYEVSSFVDSFADLKIERVVEKEGGDPKKYEIPKKEVSIWTKGQADPVKVLIGMENPLDNSFFAQKEGDPRIVLVGSLLKSPLEKKLFDFRQKDVFRFETKDVGAIKLEAKDTKWEARKRDEDWSLEAPIKALAKEMKVTALLDTLAGIRAKEFAAEAKNPEELKKLGLDKAEYTVTLSLPAANKELVFSLHKAEDKTYVTTSDSTKIVVAETDPLFELEKKADEYRENKVAAFNAWLANKVSIKKGTLSLTATKASNDKWYFDAAQKEEADSLKVDSFVRKIESLEAAEYIDQPKAPAESGLDAPQAEVTIWTKETGEKPVEKSFTVLVGKTDAEKKQAVVKNPKLAYFFRVDSAFLDEFPKEKKDWLVVPPPEPEKKDEKPPEKK